MIKRMNTEDRCQEPRYGMYTTGTYTTGTNSDQPVSTCGDFATHLADGKPVCEVHARRSLLEKKKVQERLCRADTGHDWYKDGDVMKCYECTASKPI